MVNATQPTTVNLSLLGGLVKMYIDQWGSVKKFPTVTKASINGTNYGVFQDPKVGGNYSVPAATNLRIYGFEQLVIKDDTTDTVAQLGYADNATGTNFTSLVDLLLVFAGSNNVTFNNWVTPLLTVPTGKFLLIKQTGTATTDSVALSLIGIETN